MEKQVERLVFSINELRKQLQKKELELWDIRQNCRHQLSTDYETTFISLPVSEGRFRTQEQIFRTCQKCGERVFLD